MVMVEHHPGKNAEAHPLKCKTYHPNAVPTLCVLFAVDPGIERKDKGPPALNGAAIALRWKLLRVKC